jgi:carboxylesterase type B
VSSQNQRIVSKLIQIGHYWKGLDSIIISHMKDEGRIFSPKVQNEADFNNWLNGLLQHREAAIPEIKQEYSPITDVQTRVSKMVSDGVFLCNIPPAVHAFQEKTWILQYTRKDAKHGADIPAFFYDPDARFPDIMNIFGPSPDLKVGEIAGTLQSYIISYALTGNPNSLAVKQGISWPRATQNTQRFYENVLEVGDKGFGIVNDSLIVPEACKKWMSAARLRAMGGNVTAKTRRAGITK